MGNGCFLCPKKIAPRPIPVVIPTVTTVPTILPKENPFGYVKLYAGVKTNNDKYTTPVISLHTYFRVGKLITQTNTTLNVINPTTVSANGNISHLGPSSSTNIDKQAIEKQVRCIPIEDIISIEFSTDVKKEYQTSETRQERVRPPKPKLGCWGQFKACVRENCCCCPSCPCQVCKPIPEEKPQYDTFTQRNVTANRMILIEMKCIHHSNIDIPTHVKVLPEDEKHKFYTENFNVDTIYFYLVNNNETEQNDFQKKSYEAEKLCRIIVQLRNMSDHYPSPDELQAILQQQKIALFGDEIII